MTKEGNQKRLAALKEYWDGVHAGTIKRKKRGEADPEPVKIETPSPNGTGNRNRMYTALEIQFRNYARLLWFLGKDEAISQERIMAIFTEERPEQ